MAASRRESSSPTQPQPGLTEGRNKEDKQRRKRTWSQPAGEARNGGKQVNPCSRRHREKETNGRHDAMAPTGGKITPPPKKGAVYPSGTRAGAADGRQKPPAPNGRVGR